MPAGEVLPACAGRAHGARGPADQAGPAQPAAQGQQGLRHAGVPPSPRICTGNNRGARRAHGAGGHGRWPRAARRACWGPAGGCRGLQGGRGRGGGGEGEGGGEAGGGGAAAGGAVLVAQAAGARLRHGRSLASVVSRDPRIHTLPASGAALRREGRATRKHGSFGERPQGCLLSVDGKSYRKSYRIV